MAIPLSYNVRNVVQRPASTMAAALGVAFTVAIFIGALALAQGFQAALQTTGSTDNVLLLRKGADSEITSGLSRDAVNVVKAHAQVATGDGGRPLVSPELVVVLNRPRLGMEGSSNVLVRGVDPSATGVRRQVELTAGRMFQPGADEVVVGASIAPRFAGCGIGEKLRLGRQEFTVVGHFEAGGASFESEIWGDAAVLMPALDRDGYQSVIFRMKDPSAFGALEKELEADSRLQVDVYTEQGFYASQSEMMATVVRFIGVFITLIMAVGAVFGAMNTMYAAVSGRVREIATLLVLGFSGRAILLSFMVESVILSLIGGALGCLLSWPINGLVTGTTNFASFSEVAFSFQVTPRHLLAGMAYAAAMGVVGGFLPALKAARQPIAVSLREL